MTRRGLRVSLPLTGRGPVVPSLVLGDPERWLPPPARRCGIDGWTVLLVAGRLRRSVTCHVGATWQDGGAAWRSVAWVPRPEREDVLAAERLLPAFRGELGIIVDEAGGVLRLEGSYTPPVGRLGAAIDAAILHRVASGTAQHFLADIQARLGSTAPASVLP